MVPETVIIERLSFSFSLDCFITSKYLTDANQKREKKQMKDSLLHDVTEICHVSLCTLEKREHT